MSVRLSATTFPCVAILASNSGSGGSAQLMSSVLGTVSAGQLLAALVRSVEEQGAMLVAQRAEREERVSAGGGRGGERGASGR